MKATAAAAPSGRGRRATVPAHFLRLVGPPSCVLPAPDILQQVPRLLPLRPPSRRRIRVAEGGRCRGQYVFDPKLSVTSSLLHAARFPLLQETELMPPRLALHAGADRRVAEVQLELLACAGVTWSRVETGSSNRCLLPQLQSSVNRIKASVKNRGRGCSARSFLVNQVALVAACSGATPH